MNEQKRMDREVTDAIIEVLVATRDAFDSFSKLCEAGSEYLEAKTRERFSPQNILPKIPQKIPMGMKERISPHKLVTPSKNGDV